VYIPIEENRLVYSQEKDFEYNRNTWNTAIDFSHNATLQDDFQVVTKLLAWDPQTQSARWTVDHGRPSASGVLATAAGARLSARFGLLFRCLRCRSRR
jgi:hypothetical protein